MRSARWAFLSQSTTGACGLSSNFQRVRQRSVANTPRTRNALRTIFSAPGCRELLRVPEQTAHFHTERCALRRVEGEDETVAFRPATVPVGILDPGVAALVRELNLLGIWSSAACVGVAHDARRRRPFVSIGSEACDYARVLLRFLRLDDVVRVTRPGRIEVAPPTAVDTLLATSAVAEFLRARRSALRDIRDRINHHVAAGDSPGVAVQRVSRERALDPRDLRRGEGYRVVVSSRCKPSVAVSAHSFTCALSLG